MRRMIIISVLCFAMGCSDTQKSTAPIDGDVSVSDTSTSPQDTGSTATDTGVVVDECADGTAQCHTNALCENTPSGYNCTCDTGYAGDGQSCEPVCGDDLLKGTEVCDDGNTVAGDGCRADCLGLEACGDALLDTAAGEECDDGNEVSLDGCDDRCKTEPVPGECGDGTINLGEECDDGNQVMGDGCEECMIAMSDAWTCDPALFGGGDGCECGCGQVDVDCVDSTVDSCDYCGGQGACNLNDLICQQINEENNASCI